MPDPNADVSLAEEPPLSKDAGGGFGPRLKGVGGWLLLLCFVMTVVGPIVNSVIIINSLGALKNLPQIGGLKEVAAADLIFSMVIVLMSFYAGLSLWMIKPKADRKAKGFFFLLLSYFSFAIVSPLFIDLSSYQRGRFYEAIWPKIIGGSIAALIWISYLSKSKRVKATYPQSEPLGFD